MKTSAASLVGLALLACHAKGAPPSPSTSPLVAARPYELDMPLHYDPSKPAPLLLALHGYGADGDDVEAAHFGLSSLAAAHGMFVAHPNGTRDGKGARFWNATDACCDFGGTKVDDVAYLRAVIDDVAARYAIDPKRVWVFGLSNGGFMSHRLACDASEKVAAIVSIAGATWSDAARCKPTSAVSVLEVHGGSDPRVKYEGDVSLHGAGAAYPSVYATVAASASKAGCKGQLRETGTALGFDAERLATAAELAKFDGCPAGVDVERWKMVGAGHIPRFTPAWSEAVVAWLEAHPKAAD